jgi:hypothetical protein
MLRTLLAAAALTATALPAAAGGHSCVGDCYRQAYMPARYGAVVEPALVRGPRTHAHVTPAEYRTVTERVAIRPAGRVWTVTRDAWGRKVGCWVDVPGEYTTVTRRVMVRGPEITPIAQNAVWGVASQRFLVEPAHKEWVPLD